MAGILFYLLVPLLALLLVTAQAVWGSAIKNEHLIQGSPAQIGSNLITNYRIWVGAIIYIIATLIYFFLLSRNKFFSVQITMLSLSVVFSTLLASILFHERIGLLNLVGIIVVLIGLTLVLGHK
jgi:drug/metabolite transporter (DMT)-like permease